MPAQDQPMAGHVVEQQQLASYLEKALNTRPRNVVLFLQDKVSSDTSTVLSLLDAWSVEPDPLFPFISSHHHVNVLVNIPAHPNVSSDSCCSFLC